MVVVALKERTAAAALTSKAAAVDDKRLRKPQPLLFSHHSTPTLSLLFFQVADWEPKIRKIVSWFDQLQAVDLEAEEEKERQAEAKRGGGGAEKAELFSLRADEVSQFGGDPADALREAPEKEGDFLKVPQDHVNW